jgi:hypothetical protein
MSILLGKKELTDQSKLTERRTYLNTLLDAPRSPDGPSSQEWVSDEYYDGHRGRLLQEIAEIDAALDKLTDTTMILSLVKHRGGHCEHCGPVRRFVWDKDGTSWCRICLESMGLKLMPNGMWRINRADQHTNQH